MFFKALKEFLKNPLIPVTAMILGIILGMILLPFATVIVRNFKTQVDPALEVTEESGLIKKLKAFFAEKDYDTILAEERRERLKKLREQDKTAMVGIEEAMAETLVELAQKPVQPAGPAVNIAPTLIVPGYLKAQPVEQVKDIPGQQP